MDMQSFWLNEQLPELPGDICFMDGRVVVLENRECCGKFSYRETTVASFDVEGYDIELGGKEVNPITGGVAYFGGGDMGNEGFIAYTDKNNTLLWFFFVEFSNPFFKLSFNGHNIVARTEINYEFTIPIDFPEKMICKSYNAWGY